MCVDLLGDRQHEYHHELVSLSNVRSRSEIKRAISHMQQKSPVVDSVHCLDNQRMDFNSLYSLVSTHERMKHLRPSTSPIDAEKSLIVSILSTSPE